MVLIVVCVDVGYCFMLCLRWMGHVRGVDCVCTTQQLCSSGSQFSKAGAEAIARALERNTSLQKLNFYGQLFVW